MRNVIVTAAMLLGVAHPGLAEPDRQSVVVRAVARLTTVERQQAIGRLVPFYRGIPAGPFAVNPQHPVVPNVVALSSMNAAWSQTSYLADATTGSVVLLPNQPGQSRPNVSLALAAHSRPYVVDCSVLSSETQVGYHVGTLTPGEYDTKAFEANKSTVALLNNHVLIALPATKVAQRLIIGRPSGDMVPTTFRMFVFFGCEISRLD